MKRFVQFVEEVAGLTYFGHAMAAKPSLQSAAFSVFVAALGLAHGGNIVQALHNAAAKVAAWTASPKGPSSPPASSSLGS